MRRREPRGTVSAYQCDGDFILLPLARRWASSDPGVGAPTETAFRTTSHRNAGSGGRSLEGCRATAPFRCVSLQAAVGPDPPSALGALTAIHLGVIAAG